MKIGYIGPLSQLQKLKVLKNVYFVGSGVDIQCSLNFSKPKLFKWTIDLLLLVPQRQKVNMRNDMCLIKCELFFFFFFKPLPSRNFVTDYIQCEKDSLLLVPFYRTSRITNSVKSIIYTKLYTQSKVKPFNEGIICQQTYIFLWWTVERDQGTRLEYLQEVLIYRTIMIVVLTKKKSNVCSQLL